MKDDEVVADGKFRVKTLIGRGSYGQVYIVERVSDNIKFVCKCEPARPGPIALWIEAKAMHPFKDKKLFDKAKGEERSIVPVLQHVGDWIRPGTE